MPAVRSSLLRIGPRDLSNSRVSGYTHIQISAASAQTRRTRSPDGRSQRVGSLSGFPISLSGAAVATAAAVSSGPLPYPIWPAEPPHACSQLATAHRYLFLKRGHQRQAHGVIQTALHTAHISRTLGLLSPYPSVSLPLSLSSFPSISLFLYIFPPPPLPLPVSLRFSRSFSLKREAGIRVLVPP